MFKVHKIGGDALSVKNLVLLFLTIVFGFASVITLAQINISSDIRNAWQTISKITITESGMDTQSLIELSKTGIYIDNGVLQEKTPFSGKVLGIDESGNVIYTYSENLMGDNLGNHTATENIKLGTNFISYSGENNKGIWFDTDNNLHATQKIKTVKTVQVGDAGQAICGPENGGEIRFISNCFQGCDGTSRKNIAGSGCNGIINTACLGTLPTYASNTSIGIIPANTYRSYATTPGACTYTCNANFVYDPSTSDCVATAIERACEGLPTHASWNTTNIIAQHRNGTTHIPSNIGTYNTTPSTTECRFTCDIGYTWENNACVSQITTTQCIGTLPANSINTSLENNGTRHFSMNSGNCTYVCEAGYALTKNGSCIITPTLNPAVFLQDIYYRNNYIYFGGYFRDKFKIRDIVSGPILGRNLYVGRIDTNGGNLKTSIIRLFTGDSANNNILDNSIDEVIADNSGNTYVLGNFQNQAYFDDITLTGGSTNKFIGKLDNNGHRVWVKKISVENATPNYSTRMRKGAYGSMKNDLTFDSSGNIYVLGFFKALSGYDGTTNLIFDTTATPANFSGLKAVSVIAKINPLGDAIRLKIRHNTWWHFGSIYNRGEEMFASIGADITNPYFVKIDKVSGYTLTTYPIPQNLGIIGMAGNSKTYYVDLSGGLGTNINYINNDFIYEGYIPVTVSPLINNTGYPYKYQDAISDTNGDIMACGEINGTYTIGNTSITSLGYNDVFITYKKNGSYTVKRALGSTGTSTTCAGGIVMDDTNNIYIGGYTNYGEGGYLLTGGFGYTMIYIKKYTTLE